MVEMLVVVAVMVALAGIAVVSASGTSELAAATVTTESLHAMRDAIKGTAGKPGYFDDVGISPNFKLDDLTTNPFAPTDPLYSYNPVTKKGWRGPYLTLAENPPLDGWRHVILLQTNPSDSTHKRLVSAGPNGVIEIDPGNSSNPADASYLPTDDIVVPLTKDGVKW